MRTGVLSHCCKLKLTSHSVSNAAGAQSTAFFNCTASNVLAVETFEQTVFATDLQKISGYVSAYVHLFSCRLRFSLKCLIRIITFIKILENHMSQ